MRTHHESLTTKGLKVDFYLAGCLSEEEIDHLDGAVSLLARTILGPVHRFDDPWIRARVRGEFRERLDRACKGDLIPREQCRPLGNGTLPIYEIRWQDVVVKEAVPDGSAGYVSVTLLVRLIHAEPDRPPYSAVALRAHEKVVHDDNRHTWEDQDEEIRLASVVFVDGQPTLWGLSPRGRGNR